MLIPVVKKSLGLKSIGFLRRILSLLLNFIGGKRPYMVRSIGHTLKNNGSLILNWPETSTYIYNLKSPYIQSYSFPQIIVKSDIKRESTGSEFYRKDIPNVLVPGQTIFSLEDVGSLGSEGLLYSIQGRFWIRESMSDWFLHGESIHSRYIYAFKNPDAIKIHGLTLTVTRPGAQGFYHFLHECVPKIKVLMETFPDFQTILIAPFQGSRHFVDNWLDLIGIPREKRLYAEGKSHFHFKHLISMNEWIPQYQPHKESVKAILDLLPQNIDSTKNRWILASRNDMNERTLDWEDELLTRFPNLERVFFSNLTPRETIDLMGQTSLFIGMHGAAFSNTIWMRKGSYVIEIVPGIFEPLYYRLSSVCGHKHTIADKADSNSLFNYLNNLINHSDFN